VYQLFNYKESKKQTAYDEKGSRLKLKNYTLYLRLMELLLLLIRLAKILIASGLICTKPQTMRFFMLENAQQYLLII